MLWFEFFPRKCPVTVELNLKHRKLTKVVEQTHNVSTWRDRSKKLPSKSCLLGIRKSNEHYSKVLSGCWRIREKPELRTHTRIILDFVDQNVGWGTLLDILHVAKIKTLRGGHFMTNYTKAKGMDTYVGTIT